MRSIPACGLVQNLHFKTPYLATEYRPIFTTQTEKNESKKLLTAEMLIKRHHVRYRQISLRQDRRHPDLSYLFIASHAWYLN